MLKPIELHEIRKKYRASLMGIHQSVSPGLITEKRKQPQIRCKIMSSDVVISEDVFLLSYVVKHFNKANFCIPYLIMTFEGHSQEPINCNDKGDVISGQSNRGQYNHHGDQTGLRDAGSPNTRSSGCDAVSIETSVIFSH